MTPGFISTPNRSHRRYHVVRSLASRIHCMLLIGLFFSFFLGVVAKLISPGPRVPAVAPVALSVWHRSLRSLSRPPPFFILWTQSNTKAGGLSTPGSVLTGNDTRRTFGPARIEKLPLTERSPVRPATDPGVISPGSLPEAGPHSSPSLRTPDCGLADSVREVQSGYPYRCVPPLAYCPGKTGTQIVNDREPLANQCGSDAPHSR